MKIIEIGVFFLSEPVSEKNWLPGTSACRGKTKTCSDREKVSSCVDREYLLRHVRRRQTFRAGKRSPSSRGNLDILKVVLKRHIINCWIIACRVFKKTPFFKAIPCMLHVCYYRSIMFMSPFLVTDIKRFDLSLRRVNTDDESNFMVYVHVWSN